MSSGNSPFERLVTVPVTGSTQDDLRDALTGPEASSWPHLSALRALRQTAGRGRSGHSWITPDDGALLVSVVLRPLVPAERLAWLPLLAGLAVRDALAPFVEEYARRILVIWETRTFHMAENLLSELWSTATVGLEGADPAGALEAWLAEHPGAPAALRRIVGENLDDTRRAALVQARESRG